jgi:hypothetical protein
MTCRTTEERVARLRAIDERVGDLPDPFELKEARERAEALTEFAGLLAEALTIEAAEPGVAAQADLDLTEWFGLARGSAALAEAELAGADGSPRPPHRWPGLEEAARELLDEVADPSTSEDRRETLYDEVVNAARELAGA